MKYSAETLRKYKALADKYLNEYMNTPIETLQIHISTGNSKIGHAFNVSTLAGYTCGNCSACLKYCYDVKACIRFPENVLKQRAENTALLLRDRKEFFRQIEEFISNYHGKYKFFRWHQAGEILDIAYLSDVNAIATRHNDWMFWTYTKMYKVVNNYMDANGGRDAIANNLSIMFSEWKGLPCPNPYGMPMFITVLEGDKEPKAMFKCVGNCDYCKANHRGCIAKETTWNNEH